MIKGFKIKDLCELIEALRKDREEGKTIVHCHGVFDLVHPGHIKHLKAAKKRGDRLTVSITSDRYVNKGPHRPVFTEQLRAENIAALEFVDYVFINDDKDSINLISQIRPNFYVKGVEYKEHEKDVTGKISLENLEVQKCGGELVFTDDLVFSSSKLLNSFFSNDNKKTRTFLDCIKEEYSFDKIYEAISQFNDLSVLVIGDTIIDEYVYVDPLGQSGKGIHMVAKTKSKEVFLGGAGIIANHLSSFVKNVNLFSLVGGQAYNAPMIRQRLADNVQGNFVINENFSTLTKRRYVMKDGDTLSKLFETYSEGETSLSISQTQKICDELKEASKGVDIVLVADFGNGFINDSLRKCICSLDKFIALNTQINSGNRGYHVVTHYDRADYISLNEPELRLTTHDKTGSIKPLMEQIASELRAQNLCITRGVEGVISYHAENGLFSKIPALARKVIDRVGAGDSFLALSTLAFYSGLNNNISSFLGSIAAALNVQEIGNRNAIDKVSYLKYLTTLLK